MGQQIKKAEANTIEWDVEYRESDGSTFRHTEDVFDETLLTKEAAHEHARAYNSLDGAPGVAVVVHRYVTDWFPGDGSAES